MRINKRADNNDRQLILSYICQSLLIILDNWIQDEREIYVNSTKKYQGSLFINIIPEDKPIRQKKQCYNHYL